jgi:hypothetical protein
MAQFGSVTTSNSESICSHNNYSHPINQHLNKNVNITVNAWKKINVAAINNHITRAIRIFKYKKGGGERCAQGFGGEA